MAEFKNSIMLGIEIDSKGAQGKLETIIKTLNENKVNLDIKIKDSNVAKQLEQLTNLAKDFKKVLGENVSLSNLDKSINETVSAMDKLNSETLKTRTILNQDGTGVRFKEMADGIGTVKKQMEVLNKETGKWDISKTSKTIIENNNKIKQSLEDITKAQEKLNSMESNGVVNKNSVADLKNMFSNPNNFSSDGELKTYLNQVKGLENEENRVANEIQNAWDKAYANRISSEQKALSQIEANEKKAYDQEILRFGEKAIAEQKAEQDLINQMANGREKAELKSQKADRSQELAQSKAINQALEEEYKLQQENEMLLKHQAEFYKQIDLFKSNGILNKSDVDGLERMVQNATKLSQMHSLFGEFQMATMKESSIASLSKQLEDAQIKLNKMKQSFGSKLPSGFAESIEGEINKLKDSLKKVDGMNFNGLKNSLNQVNTEMKVVTNETQQLVNASKGGIFSNIGDFLSKIGVFYGVQQVVQEISQQLRSASEYVISMDTHTSNIEMITGRTKESVLQITGQFKELAVQLHATNEDVMSSAEEMMRAGYSDDESKKMIEQATIGAKISNQTTEQVSQQLIALKNAFNMSADDMSRVIDVFSKMDNTSATSFKELADAVQRTAFSAQEAGVPLETLTAYITTTSEKTRKAASTIDKLVA